MADIRRATKLPNPDSRGRIRPYVGVTADGRRARFFVGDKSTSPAEAMQRLELIRRLYEKQCERSNQDYWHEWSRKLAIKIGNGQSITDAIFSDDSFPYPEKFRAQMVTQLREWGIPVDVTDSHAIRIGLAEYQQELQTLIQTLVQQELSKLHASHGEVIKVAINELPDDPLDMSETTTLHQAIDAYSRHLEATGKRDSDNNLSTRTHKCKDRQKYLKNAHTDIPLWKLDLPELEKMVSHWRNRPVTKKQTRCSIDHATDQLQELWRLLDWLDSHPNYKWHWPKGAEKIKRTPIRLPQDIDDDVWQTTTKASYTPAELAVICKYTDDFGRALIAVCVNCAFGQSEVGQWSMARFLFNHAHPYANKIGIDTSSDDSWIVGPRPKTHFYGEHLLWTNVANALKPYNDGREVLPITSAKSPWYKTHTKNPQAKFGNWWTALIKRARKDHPDLPKLPFGSLRDTLPDVLRQHYSDDVASLALQHKTYSEDELLKCYTNLPFARLFRATRELEDYFKPLLDCLA